MLSVSPKVSDELKFKQVRMSSQAPMKVAGDYQLDASSAVTPLKLSHAETLQNQVDLLLDD